jgi:hypothetical protein
MRHPILWLIGLVFVIAGVFVTRINGLPHFVNTPADTATLSQILAANGLQQRAMPVTKGELITQAVRFALPACDADGFVLPVADIQLTDVQAPRFTEITGATYESHPQRMVNNGGVLGARAARAMAAFKAVMGLPAPRNSHTVLVLFMPKGCQTPPPDFSAYWAVQDNSG